MAICAKGEFYCNNYCQVNVPIHSNLKFFHSAYSQSYLLVSESHLIVLREIPGQKGAAHVVVKRPLSSIVRITSRKRHADLITFKYGTTQYNGTLVVTDMDRFVIPNASEATKLIMQQIMKQLNISDE